MLDFRSLFEFLFKSFRISRDTEQIESLIQEGQRYVMLVKRSLIYGVFTALLLIPVGILATANIILVHRHFEVTFHAWTLSVMLAVNFLFALYYGIRYLVYYRRTYQGSSEIIDVYTALERLTRGDRHFTRFFNQAMANLAFSIVIIIYYVGHIIFISRFSQGLWMALDIVCVIAGFFLLRYYADRMLNLEMDYTIVVPERMYFVNQIGMYADVQTLDAEKIKTIRSRFPNFLASFFHYGITDILTEGDMNDIGVIRLPYVSYPEETVANMQRLLDRRTEMLDKVHNVYLQRIVSQYQIDRDADDFQERIRLFLRDYEEQIKRDYIETQDEQTKREIRDIYERYGHMTPDAKQSPNI